MNEKDRQEKIDMILTARPKLKAIIAFATDDQLDALVAEVQKELQHELFEAAFT